MPTPGGRSWQNETTCAGPPGAITTRANPRVKHTYRQITLPQAARLAAQGNTTAATAHIHRARRARRQTEQNSRGKKKMQKHETFLERMRAENPGSWPEPAGGHALQPRSHHRR